MLGRRLLAAALIIPTMLGILWLDYWLGLPQQWSRPGLVLSLFALLTGALAAQELAAMLDHAASHVNPLTLMASVMAMILVASAPVAWAEYPPDCPLGRMGFVVSGLVAGLVIQVAVEMARFDASGRSARGEVLDRLGRAALVLLYLGTAFGFLIPHRFIGVGTESGPNGLGLFSLVMLITTVKLSDASAYFAGKALGTIKLAPRLSPGKTLQGSIGGLIGGCAGAVLMVYLIAPLVFGLSIDKPWWWVGLYGLLVTLAGMFGDLAESMFKRDANTKDSSTWLPGLGGVLDIVDSLVFAAPISFLLWL